MILVTSSCMYTFYTIACKTNCVQNRHRCDLDL